MRIRVAKHSAQNRAGTLYSFPNLNQAMPRISPVAKSGNRRCMSSTRKLRGGPGKPQGATKGGHREDYRVKFLKIPQLCEIKTDRLRLVQSAGFDPFDEPLQTAIDRGFRVRRGEIEQDLNRERCFFNGGWRAAPA